MFEKYNELKNEEQVSQLSLDEKRVVCVYIHCFFIIGEIVKEVYNYLVGQNKENKEKQNIITRSSAFWVYHWLVEDFWKYDILKVSQNDRHRFLDEITHFFLKEFNFQHSELNKMLEEVGQASNGVESNTLLKLSEYFGEDCKNSATTKAEITLLVQSHFEPYREGLHDILGWDEKTMKEVIVDFYTSCYFGYFKG
jgi:hypothetical protein